MALHIFLSRYAACPYQRLADAKKVYAVIARIMHDA
jgi:hypothetical protein